MKTLCFSLGLLLFIVCRSDAGPVGFHHSTVLEKCCFEFSEEPLELRRVTGIIRTPQRCQHQAFIVFAIGREEFCFRANFDWAMDVCNYFYPEGC